MWLSECDGIIPVLIQEVEAVPIPFRILEGNSTPSFIRDLDARPIPAWNFELEKLAGTLGTSIHCELLIKAGSRSSVLSGASFGLPVALAHARKHHLLPEFSPIQFIASGVIQGGCAEPPAGTEAKRSMAKNMGAAFFTPGQSESDGNCACIAQILEEVDQILIQRELARLSPPQTKSKLEQLQKSLHTGKITSQAALKRVEFLLRNFDESSTSPIATDAKILGEIIRASAANHHGDSATALRHLVRVGELYQSSRDPELLIHARANLVVQLTDSFALQEAMTIGRALMEYVETQYTGPAELHIEAQMRASGVLGGQPLLSLALRNQANPMESKQFLERCHQHAMEIQKPSECCRSIAQLCLWYAAFSPDQFEIAFAKAGEVFNKFARESQKSTHFVNAYRLMAARRRAAFHDGIVEEGYESWPLPQCNEAELAWLRAMALKYRASIHAYARSSESAKDDFFQARSIIPPSSTPLLRLLNASISVDWLCLADLVYCPFGIGDLLTELRQINHIEAERWLQLLEQKTDKNTLHQIAREFRY